MRKNERVDHKGQINLHWQMYFSFQISNDSVVDNEIEPYAAAALLICQK